MIENIKSKIRCLVCDVDNTLLNLRFGFYASILNADLLIPILRFASLRMPVAIDTARDQALDNDLLASGAVSVTELLKFMKKVGVHFSEEAPDLIVMSESVLAVREQYMSQFPYGTEGWNTFVMEKNPDLHLIMKRINEHGEHQSDFVPCRPDDILILDDSPSVVQKAKEAGFRAILVPLDFTPNAVGTINVDYLYELAELIGLAEYAEILETNPAACQNDPAEFVNIAMQYIQAKKNRSQAGSVFPCFVHEELEQNLVELVAIAPKMVYQILIKFKNKSYFCRLIDQQRTTEVSELQRTMLGMAILQDDGVFVPLLLKLGASTQQVFDLSDTHRSVTPMLAAILNNCRVEIFIALFNAKAKLQGRYQGQSVLDLSIAFFQASLSLNRGEVYKKLEIIVLSIQRQEGKDEYLNLLLPLFISIVEKRDIGLLDVCLLNLEPAHKEKLVDSLLLKEKKAKKNIVYDLDRGVIQHFFFQLPRQIICPLLNSSVKPILSPSKSLKNDEAMLNELLQLLKAMFFLESHKKRQLLSGKKPGSGFFKIKSSEPFTVQEKFVLFTIYLEQLLDSGQLDRVQNRCLMSSALSALISLKVSEFYSLQLKAQIDAAIIFLENRLQELSLSVTPEIPSDLNAWDLDEQNSSSTFNIPNPSEREMLNKGFN